MSMREWSQWERRIYSDLNYQQLVCIKIPEDVKFIQGKVVRKKTDFDFVVAHKGQAIFFDAKCMSTEERFNYKSRLTNDKKIHQLYALIEAKRRGAIAGLLFYFEKSNLIAWADIEDVKRDIDSGNKTITPDTDFLVCQHDTDPINLPALIRRRDDRATFHARSVIEQP